MATTYQILALVAVLAVIAALVVAFRHPRPDRRLSPLAALAFCLVIAGVIFGEPRWLSYALLGAGVVLAVVDMVIKRGQSTP